MMAIAALINGAMAILIKYYLKKQNTKFEEDEARGIFAHGHVQGSKAGHGGEAVVSFRYVH